MTGTSAVQDALKVYRQPSRLRLWRHQELPQDFLVLIKICAGDSETTDTWAKQFDLNETELHSAAVFIVNHVISRAGTDNFRLLGLPQSANAEDIRIHKRWLLKWLHPDRNHSTWESALFRKVTEAAKRIESPQVIDLQKNIPALTTRPVVHNAHHKSASSGNSKHRRSSGSGAFTHANAGKAGASKAPHLPGLVRTAQWKWLVRRAMRRLMMVLSVVAAVAAVSAFARYFVLPENADLGLFSGLRW
jgi:hypothetical protein